MVGGSLKSLKKVYAGEVNNIQSRYLLSKIPWCSELDIVFLKRDTRGVTQPHDDPSVMMLKIEEFNIHRVLVDNRSL